MRLPWIISSFVLIACVHVGAQATAPSAKESEAELLRLETALNEGVMHRDLAALETILGEEFGLSVTDRPAAARKDWLYNVANTISMSAYKITEPHVSVWGRGAVVRTRQHFDDYKSTGNALPPDYNIVDLWTYRAGRWQLVRRLSDRLRQP